MPAPAQAGAGAAGPPLTPQQAAMLAALRPLLGTMARTLHGVLASYHTTSGGVAGVPALALSEAMAAMADVLTNVQIAMDA